jgi:glycolate oxidase FAD binding subunit
MIDPEVTGSEMIGPDVTRPGVVCPETTAQLADVLREIAQAHRTIRLGGNFTKDRIGGPVCPAEVTVSASSLRRVLKYEPRDLTISVEAGLPWAELERTLAEQGQMLPLDPAFFRGTAGSDHSGATVGGVIGANQSGPLRRQYGTARDMVIGMTFVTVEGKEIRTGGNVVKNVAGLDMGKLMIGSYGTLAAIASVNFKVFPIPPASRTFVMEFDTAAEAFAERDRILRGQLPPAAVDLVNWPAKFRLLIRAMGTPAVVERFTREFTHARALDDDEQTALWRAVREFTPGFLDANPSGTVVAIPTPLSEMAEATANLGVPFLARAGSGVVFAHYAAPPANPPVAPLRDDVEMMKRVKRMFDPENLLNRGRLHGYL